MIRLVFVAFALSALLAFEGCSQRCTDRDLEHRADASPEVVERNLLPDGGLSQDACSALCGTPPEPGLRGPSRCVRTNDDHVVECFWTQCLIDG